MPRKGPVKRRELLPDTRYSNILVTRLINRVMIKGKKSKAEEIVYQALESAETKSGKSAVECLEAALEHCKPLLEVRPRRVGGATYQIPVEVSTERSLSLGMKWLVRSARNREGRAMNEKLAMEILEAMQGQGGAVKKKEEAHKMAEANKAFASYRW